MRRYFSLIKKHYLFFILTPILIYVQLELLKPQLKFGFSDIDWGFLNIYKQLNWQHSSIIDKFIQNWGVYAHQTYYIGIQEEFFGLNFEYYQITTQVFKILGIIAAYPLFLIITGNIPASIVSMVLFAFAYPAVATIHTVVTSSDYIAILFMNLFFWFYIFLVQHNIKKWHFLTIGSVLFLLTLFLSTERMYPTIVWLILIEVFLAFFHKFSKVYSRVALKRIAIFFSPMAAVFLIKAMGFIDFLNSNGGRLIKDILSGNLSHFIRPFVSMGSMIVPQSFWKYFGEPTINSFSEYMHFFRTGPLTAFIIMTMVLCFIFERSIKFIFQILIIVISFSILTFILISNQNINFDITFTTPALIGEYMVVFGLVSFVHWYKYQQREKLLIGIFAGFILAFIYILMTWIASDIYLVPFGVHRYLAVPALLNCLAFGSVLALMAKKLMFTNRFKVFVFIPFLILVPIILIWSSQITNFLQGELKNGFGASDKQLMKDQLLNFLGNMNGDERSLFYFDFNDDQDNHYYYDNTILGGFSAWMMWDPRINFRDKLAPVAIWSKFDQLVVAKTQKDDIAGFLINDHFYSLQNFYAFKLKDKKVFDIKERILNQLDMATYSK